ncbi:hypothetical protein CFC21_090987 [Triticum aestivum]|uniref:DUF4220 domain-containing protein n=2 Tax=Triticum aestivum TaxID=4565 RepID=A0A3B6QBT6_WHEAT|nr:uncharacterized protein LOC123143091 [Triticum aestivum]KAF7087830.1 hypothetical protein CFC21_090987 [Triticum aestivum]
MMRRALRENGAAAVSKAAISSTLVAVVSATLSLETKLMALALALGGLYLLQRVLVGKRRRSGHWLVQYGAMAAYYLPVPLVFYATKAVSSTSHSHHIHEDTPSLVVGVFYMFRLSLPSFQEVVAPLVTNMRAYSLHDRPQDGYNYLMWLLFLGWVDWGIILDWARCCRRRVLYRLVQMGLDFFLTLFTLFAHTSESTLDCQTKAVADYMKRESSKSSSTSTTSPFFDEDDDANSNSSLKLLDCCRYPFVQRGNGEWATVKDLVQRDDLPNEDKDIWLSYSLCRLLARRYYGFHCAEEGDDKVRCLALADLTRADGYKRVFTIGEVQLAFLHDYFFTASLPIIESGLKYIDVAQQFLGEFYVIISIFSSGIPLVIATFMSLCSLFENPMSLLVKNLVAIYWRPIHTAFRKLNDLPNHPRLIIIRFRPNPNVQDVFDPFQAQTGGAYWRNKIGQYSILQDYDRRRSPKKALVAWFHRIVLSQPSYRFIKHLPVEEDQVDMLELDNMRELVANTLRDIDGPPTNGTRSLKINMGKINRATRNRDSPGYDWLWTCKQETHTDAILIWHIATCYCDMTPISDDPLVKWHHEVAKALSRYCAYLVAFLPEFLPEHSLTTKQVFQRVLQEAQQELGEKPMKEEEKRTKIRGLQLPDQHEQRTTFHKGIDLGRQLEMLSDDNLRWKVMAEFWAEMILYIAPSDNAEAHIAHLAKGGEFITHLWAMLSNAGILKRATGEWHLPHASTTKRGTPKKIETTKARTQECPF